MLDRINNSGIGKVENIQYDAFKQVSKFEPHLDFTEKANNLRAIYSKFELSPNLYGDRKMMIWDKVCASRRNSYMLYVT